MDNAYREEDFGTADHGIQYLFYRMKIIYGAAFDRNWDGVPEADIRDYWIEQLGKYLTYKPSIDYALTHMHRTHVPSMLAVLDLMRNGPRIPEKPIPRIEREPSQYEKARTQIAKDRALERMRELMTELKAKQR